MKHKTIILLFLFLSALAWKQVTAQHAVWWGGSPPSGNTARDHSISYGNGFAWQVALGTAQSDDRGHDAIALSSGGYLVVGSNTYFNQEWFITHCDLALYRLDEEGLLVWEKLYAIEDYKGVGSPNVIEKPDGGFIVSAQMGSGTNPPMFMLFYLDSGGDTINTKKWRVEGVAPGNLKISKSQYDDAFFLSYSHNVNQYPVKVYKFNFCMDTIAYTMLPYNQFVPKPFGFIYRGASYESLFYYYLSNQQGVVLDSFPDPLGQHTNYWLYPILSISPQRNGFFRGTHQGTPTVFKMAITNNNGEVLNINTNCFSSDNLFWFNHLSGGGSHPTPFSDGGFLIGLNWYLDYYDSNCIGLAKISSIGELTGDTILTRYGDTWLIKTLEGNDGKPLIFGYGENGPLGGPTFGEDILLAKLDSWNPVGVHTPFALGTPALRVYPNPANDAVVVTLPTGAKGTLTVQTLLGSVIHSQPVAGNGELTLSTANWPAGPLIVSLSTPNGVLTTKLVKN